MSSFAKQKGYALERAVVLAAHKCGLEAKRAWASDGRSMGWSEKVDVDIGGLFFQLKSRKKLPEVVRPESGIDGQIFKENRGETFVMIRLHLLLMLLGIEKDYYITQQNLESPGGGTPPANPNKEIRDAVRQKAQKKDDVVSSKRGNAPIADQDNRDKATVLQRLVSDPNVRRKRT